MKQFFPFRLDPVNQCLWRGEAKVSLRPKAFAVLAYLVQHAGRLVSQKELLDALWADTFVQPDVLKSHVLEVRSVLGDNPKSPLFIETLPRRGYRFIKDVIETAAQISISAAVSGSQIIGREPELEKLHDYLRRACTGERQVVFVSGEAGIGKTTLVDAFTSDARKRVSSIRIARGQSVEGHGGQEPYYPVLVALAEVLREREALVPFLETHAPTWLVQFPTLLKQEHRQLLQREILGATRQRMIRELCEVLPHISAEETLLLVLEDIHWADPATIELIAAIAYSQAQGRLLLIATYRPVEVVLSQHPLKRVQQDLIVHRLCHELAIEALSEVEVERYLTAQSPGHRLPDGLAEVMHRVTEGNPLFLRAALDHLLARGHLACAQEQWRINIPLKEIEKEVPDSLRQMLELEVERLSQEERRALDAASVCGISLLAHVGAAAGEFDPEGYEEICQQLSHRRQILRVAGLQNLSNGATTLRCRFIHAFYRQAIYDRLPPRRRSRLHLRVGCSLEALSSETSGKNPSELALHFEAGGDWMKAARYLQLASVSKGQRFAYREVAADLEHALELLSRLPKGEGTAAEMEIMQKLGAIYFALEDLSRSIAVLEQVADRAALAHEGLAEMNALFQVGCVLTRTSNSRTLNVAQRLLDLSHREKDPGLQARAQMCALMLRLMALGVKQEDAQQFRSALAEVSSSLDSHAQAAHTAQYAAFELFKSDYQSSIRTLEETLPVLVEAGDIGHRFALIGLVMGLVFCGNWGKALRVAQNAVATAQKNEDHIRESALRVYQALAHVFAHDWTGALESCESALPALSNPGRVLFFREALVLAGTALVGLGRYELASNYLLQARDGMDANQVSLEWYWRMPLQAALTELYLQRGELAQAQVEAQRFVEASLATEERAWQALAWEASARVALAGSDLQQGQECIRKAIAVMEGFDVPPAFWRVHATAMQLFPENAEEHHRVAVDVVLRLAESLKEFPQSRDRFLSSKSVRNIIANQMDLSRLGDISSSPDRVAG